ncbi:unnamed protein product [Hymenolepis diminuta]|uniref:Uncharacterized protein n=1 Tax=Hymenolepis diminuta TaxID=6216 RepID=A0A564Z9V5_HYMDI|nr:unnamed protein product [Hymenolepis diminuta]
MKASLLCFVENFRTFLYTPELKPSEYVIVNPFTEFPAYFPKLPKEERIVLIGWMAFFLKYIEHAIKKEYFFCEFVNELYVGGSHISKYCAYLEKYLNAILHCDPSLIGIYDHWCGFYYSI